jgi:alanine racemase
MREERIQGIELDGTALRKNLGLFRNLIGRETELAMVVKANAYGHGVAEVVPAVSGLVDWLAVHSAAEARQLRDLGFRGPILIMGFLPAHDFFDLDQDMHVLVSTEQVLDNVRLYKERTRVNLPVHLKIDTGTRRQGMTSEEVPAMIARAGKWGIEVVGVATHFANIEDTLEHDFARLQLQRFSAAIELVREHLGSEPRWIHAACSAAALLFRETDFTLVRVGISAYGHWSSRETRLSWKLEHGGCDIELSPVLTWRTAVGQLQKVAKGETVGYGRTWTALRDTVLAVLPVGYADGYPRALGNQARVVIGGLAAPVVGRVCMNIMMVDVTDVADVAVGDEVVLLGRSGGLEISAEELAALAGTINYEFLARLSLAIPRTCVERA